MKIVVVGCGKIGGAIIDSLAKEGHDIVAIDINENVVSALGDTYDIMTVIGNGVDSDVLMSADVGKCELFIAVTQSDEINMLCCFIADKMGAKNTIARIRNPEYNDKNFEFVTKQLNISRIINPELLAAQELFNLLRFPSAIKIETFSTRKFEMIELRLKNDSVLDGITLSELRNKYKSKILVCTVQREEETFIPGGSFVLKSGDRVDIAASPKEIQSFLKELGVFQKMAKNIMLLGGGRISRYLADMLLGIGNSVKIIEQDRKVCEELSESLPQADIVEGNGAKHEILVEEGLGTTDAFVSLTGIDEENILISIFSATHGVPTVISKINNDELSAIAEKLGVDCYVTPSKIVSNVVVQYARALASTRGSTVKTVYKIMDGKAEALEFDVLADAKCINIPLKEMKIKENVLIAGIVREKRTIVPSGLDVILPGDTVIIVANEQKVTKMDDILA